MKTKKLRRAAALLLLFAQLLLLAACVGGRDWDYSDLPGDYEIWRFSAKKVALVKRVSATGADTVVASYVNGIAWDENYILVRRETDSDSDSSVTSYYIVDVKTEEVGGPYEKTEFYEHLNALGIAFDDDGWIPTQLLKR